jgi:hypothetical protein
MIWGKDVKEFEKELAHLETVNRENTAQINLEKTVMLKHLVNLGEKL